MNREKALLLMGLAALFHHARLSRRPEAPCTAAYAFAEAEEFLAEAEKRMDVAELLGP